MGSSIGSTFGKFDKNATRTVMNGQPVDPGTAGATTLPDPSGGLTSGQQRNRKIAKVAGGTLSSAFNQGNGPQRYGMQGVNFDFANNQPTYQPMTARNPNPFFGS